MSAALLSTIGIPVLITILTNALKSIDSPIAKNAADSLSKITSAMQTGAISAEQIAEANRHAEEMAKLELEGYTNTLEETHKSMRAEISSNDPYVRRMRPTFGYLMAVTWAAQMLGLAYVIVFETDKAGFVLNAMSNLSAIWAMGLSVLGIYVYKRSEEKKSSATDPIYWSKPRN